MNKVLILLLIPIALEAQKNYPEQLNSYMQAEFYVNGFNGNVLVAKKGSVIYQKSFGFRNYTSKELLDNNSVFELASVSKQFTAMGILLLKEKGSLKLADSLRKFFPELPYKNITIQNLLTHTSGLPDYGDSLAIKWDHKKVAFNNDAINFLSKEKLPVNFNPGEKWEYSNTGYDLLASIIEKVSGLSFREYMQKFIFKPLGMKYSLVYNTRRSSHEIVPDYSYGYVYSDSLKRYILPDSLPEYDYVIWADGIQGSGLINSTTGDLLKWDRSLKNHTLLSESTNIEMLSPQSIMDTIAKKYYGYGVIIGKNEIGDYIMHTGSWPGVSSNLQCTKNGK
jgi:CubicO group peptidase (beta-lactamase class C family)